jgi:hypothetical protein
MTSARSFASKAFSAATRSRFSPTAAALLMVLAFRQEKLNRREQPGGETVSRVHHQWCRAHTLAELQSQTIDHAILDYLK